MPETTVAGAQWRDYHAAIMKRMPGLLGQRSLPDVESDHVDPYARFIVTTLEMARFVVSADECHRRNPWELLRYDGSLNARGELEAVKDDPESILLRDYRRRRGTLSTFTDPWAVRHA